MFWKGEKIMLMKIGRREFDISNDDIIFDNGACYQLVTQMCRKGFDKYYQTMSKTQFKKLLKEEKLVLVDEKLSHTTSDGKEIYYRNYRFNIE